MLHLVTSNTSPRSGVRAPSVPVPRSGLRVAKRGGRADARRLQGEGTRRRRMGRYEPLCSAPQPRQRRIGYASTAALAEWQQRCRRIEMGSPEARIREARSDRRAVARGIALHNAAALLVFLALKGFGLI